MPIGWPELIIVLVIVLLVFGPKRLPMLGRQLGGGMREFKDSITKKDGPDRDDAADEATDAFGRPAELNRGAQADPLDPQTDTTRAPAGGRDESATRAGRDPS
jgi:sec-independent protein translocase protein TatA